MGPCRQLSPNRYYQTPEEWVVLPRYDDGQIQPTTTNFSPAQENMGGVWLKDGVWTRMEMVKVQAKKNCTSK